MSEPLTIRRWVDDEGFSLHNAVKEPLVTVATKALGYEIDPEALRDWIEEQRPKPRYYVVGCLSPSWPSQVHDRNGARVACFVHGRDAEEFAALLNERHGAE